VAFGECEMESIQIVQVYGQGHIVCSDWSIRGSHGRTVAPYFGMTGEHDWFCG